MTSLSNEIALLAETVDRTSQDAVLLSTVVVILLFFALLFSYLIRQAESRQRLVLSDYRDRLNLQYQDFREVLTEQRTTNSADIDKLVTRIETRIDDIDDNLGVLVERYLPLLEGRTRSREE